MSQYGFGKILADTTLEQARPRVTEALKAEGFGVLTEIDLAATLRAKLGAEHRPYVILGACNPVLANQAVGLDPEIGLLLPCNVILREVDGGTQVSMIDPQAMFGVMEGDTLQPIADEAEARLRRALAAL
ncbi:MAG: DUF302 domain-containing protein [Myxococcales bacterium]|nr:DUF302 domain-containing protein [Myxococcales bacterium]MCB9713251.1 DUF302 domain-containing protein [Myxococcales bacterium]